MCNRFQEDLPSASTSSGSPLECVLEPGILSTALGPRLPAGIEDSVPVSVAADLPDILPVANLKSNKVLQERHLILINDCVSNS